MLSVEERRKFAQCHVEFGRFLIGRQREMIERHKAEGRDPAPAQNLLAVLERTQQVLERDLAQLMQTGQPPNPGAYNTGPSTAERRRNFRFRLQQRIVRSSSPKFLYGKLHSERAILTFEWDPTGAF